MGSFLGYRCSFCGEEYGPEEEIYNCRNFGGNLDVILDYESIRQKYWPQDFKYHKQSSMWRYKVLLPAEEPYRMDTPLRQVGYTPTYHTRRLAKTLGLKHLWIKDESGNPTGSFKDRASALVMARAEAIGVETVVTASTGNAGAALAGMSAAAGHKSVIFAPRNAPNAKIAQLVVFGAKVFLIDGSYDDAYDLSLQATHYFGWYNRNSGFNPFTIEGKKTAAFEIWEKLLLESDLATAEKPLVIFVSVGDGNIISGIHKGFKDLQAIGWLEQMPRIFGVQSKGSAAIANAFHANTEMIIRVNASSVADSITVDLPRDGLRAIRAAKQTNGNYVTVEDEQILQAIPVLGQIGVFAEPAGAAAFAGLVQSVKDGLVGPDDPVLVINTGNGLKDVGAAIQAVKAPPIIEPTMSALKKAMGK